MSKALVCVNVLHSVNSMIYGSHCQEWFRLGRNTKDEFILFHPERFSIDNARNQAAKIAMHNECDYIYFIDDDMILSPNTYSSLKACEADVAMALTFVRGYPFEPMFFHFTEDQKEIKKNERRMEHFKDWQDHISANGLVECDAVGFACCLLKVEPLLQLTTPYFITGTYHTEDVYYCLKLKDELENVKIVVDTKVPTGHLLLPEAISIHSIDKLKIYHKPEIEPAKQETEYRGEEYLKECQSKLNLDLKLDKLRVSQ